MAGVRVSMVSWWLFAKTEWSGPTMAERGMVRCWSMVRGRRIGSRSIWGRRMMGFRVYSSPFIFDISYETSFMVSVVGDYLNTAIRQSNPVLSCHHAILILNFLLGKVSSRVGILQKKNYNFCPPHFCKHT